MALVEACGGLAGGTESDSKPLEPTRAAVAAARALHELCHALGRAASWATAATAAEYEDDSDDEDEARAAKSRALLGRKCREILWRLRAPLAATLRVQIRWYSAASSHRGPFVAALADFRAEIGGDALSLASGEYDAPGAAAAAARQQSTVARGCEGVAETLYAAEVAERDGDDERAARSRSAVSAAIEASATRFAWLVRVMPPSELTRDWQPGNKDSEAAAALEEHAHYLAAVTSAQNNQDYGEEDSDDDVDGREYFRSITEKRATAADTRRAITRRFCLLLGQIKRKRVGAIFARRPDLVQRLNDSCSALLRTPAAKVPENSVPNSESRYSDEMNHRKRTDNASVSERENFLAAVTSATASMAAIATRRLLENAVVNNSNRERVSELAAPLLILLDDSRDAASSTVSELIAPLALLEGGSSVLTDVLTRATSHRSLPNLDAVRTILEHAAVADRSAVDATEAGRKETRRKVRKEIAETLISWLATGPRAGDTASALISEQMGKLFGRLDADIVVPLACARLRDLSARDDDIPSSSQGAKKQNDDPQFCRMALEGALGTCISEGQAPAIAIDHLAHALRNLRIDGVKPSKRQTSVGGAETYKSASSPTQGNSPALRSHAPDKQRKFDEGIILQPWVERVLDRVPAWMVKVAMSGADRWIRTAENAAHRAATHAKDAIALRIWGAVADTLADDEACFRALRRIALIMARQVDVASDNGKEVLLFERLAPLLALKRVPAHIWLVRYFSGSYRKLLCRR